MNTPFPTALDYLASAPSFSIGDTSIGEQPASMPAAFRFGGQPKGLQNVDNANGTRRKVLVIAAGDVWRKFARWGLDHRGTEYFVFDPDLLKDDPAGKPDRKTAKEKREIAGVDDAHCLSSLEALPPGIDFALNLTPPELHTKYILWAQERELPMMVEKPLVASNSDFSVLDEKLSNAKAPVYCMDWEAAHAMALAAVIGKETGVNVPFSDAVQYTNPERFSEFDFKNIARIEGTLVEKADAYGDMDYVKRNRPLIYKDGVLKDMGVHPMAALACMGFKPGEVTDVILGDTEGQKELGNYRKIGNGEDTPAWYARAQMLSHFNGQTIPTTIEVAKAGAEHDAGITFVDKNGNVLDWKFGHEKSEVTLRRKGEDKPIASANAEIDPYAMMFEQATRFFEEQKSSPVKTALYYSEQRDVLNAVAEMERRGRVGTVESTDTVKQLALEPSHKASLGIPQIDGLNGSHREPGFVHRVPAPRDPVVPDGTGMARTSTNN